MTPKVPNTENPGLFDVFSVFLHWLPQQVSSVNCLIFRFFFRRIDLAEIILCWIIKSGISFTKFLSSCLLTKTCVLLFFTGLAGGFWGNHVLHNGVVEFEIATQNIVGIVRHIQEMSRKYNEVLQKDIEQNMNKLYDGPFQRDIRQSPTSHLEIMDNSDTSLKRENCKFALWILIALIFGLSLGFGIRYGLIYLADCCVTSTGALVLTCIGIIVGLILLGLSSYGVAHCLYSYISLCPHYISWLCSCPERDRKDENYLFGYA